MSGLPPIIIIGMHRSGTSLVTRLLTDMGMFSGARRTDLYEANFFANLNRWMLHQAGATWDHPEPFAELISGKPTTRDAFVDYLDFLVTSLRTLDFLGLMRYTRYRSLYRIGELWGWKDPRTSFTLPIWLRLFPDAKIVCVRRNGVDVAASLQERSMRTIANFEQTWKRPLNQLIYQLSWKSNPKMLNRHLQLDDGFALWEMYNRHIDNLLTTLPAAQQRIIRYEDLLASADATLRDIAEFVGMAPDEATSHQLCTYLNAERAFAFVDKPPLRAFYDRVRQSDMMCQYGYDTIA